MSDSFNSSSSDECDHENLLKALDPAMFCAPSMTPAPTKCHANRQSHKDNVLNVSPGVQNFIAQRLSKVLEKSISECVTNPPLFKCCNSGIRLFSNSTKILTDKKFHDIWSPNCKSTHKSGRLLSNDSKNKFNENESSDDLEDEAFERAKCAAVSIEWINKKEGVKGWSKPKSEEFFYKKNSCGVFEIAPTS